MSAPIRRDKCSSNRPRDAVRNRWPPPLGGIAMLGARRAWDGWDGKEMTKPQGFRMKAAGVKWRSGRDSNPRPPA
jgi:hypothetical protein